MSVHTSSQRPGATVGPGERSPTLRWTYRRASGRRREVLVGLDASGVWLVYDLPAARRAQKRGLLVERLGEDDDELWQAVALAEDYVACQEAFHSSRRDACTCPDPLPGPKPLDLEAIQANTARATLAARFAIRRPAAA